MWAKDNKQPGFTIVELLIVIVVIAILAAISIVAYNGIQDRTNKSKVDADINSLVKAVQLARVDKSQTLLQITNNTCTRCGCPYANGDMTDYSSLPKTHVCWLRYYDFLDRVGAGSGVSLNGLRSGDPWGSPYIIDENEGEAGGCGRDSIQSVGKGRNSNAGTSLPVVNIALSGFSGCA